MTIETPHNQEPLARSIFHWWNPLRWSMVVWTGLIIMLIATSPFGIRWFFLSHVPAIPTPFDEEAFIGESIPDDQNAFVDYRLATEMRKKLVKGLVANSASEPNTYEDITTYGWEAADEETVAWLEKHQEASAVWLRGTSKDRSIGAALRDINFATTLSESQELRAFVRLAMIQQVRLLHEGKVEEAWKLARAAYRSGGHASARGPVVSGLIGIALHSVASEGIRRWAEHPSVTSTQLRESLAQIRSDYTLYEPESGMLKSEYLVIRNSMQIKNWISLVGPLTVGTPQDTLSNRAQSALLWVIGEPDMTIRISTQILANQLKEIDKPVSQRRKLVGSGMAMLFDPDPSLASRPGEQNVQQIDNAVKMSFISKLIIPAMKRFDDVFQNSRSRQVALEMMLALQAYRRDKGEFPADLTSLTPDYLTAIPFDPCDPKGGLMLYRRESPQKAVVYSVGIDGGDHGGDVVVGKQNNSPDIGFELKGSDVP